MPHPDWVAWVHRGRAAVEYKCVRVANLQPLRKKRPDPQLFIQFKWTICRFTYLRLRCNSASLTPPLFPSEKFHRTIFRLSSFGERRSKNGESSAFLISVNIQLRQWFLVWLDFHLLRCQSYQSWSKFKKSVVTRRPAASVTRRPADTARIWSVRRGAATVTTFFCFGSSSLQQF